MADLDAQRARQASLIVIGIAIVGAILIRLFQRSRNELEAWVAEDLELRVKLVAVATIVLLSGPLFGAAAYLVRRDDTPERRRTYRRIGLFLAASGALLAVFFWRFVLLLLASRR